MKPEILIHPNIPKPLHGLNPRSVMGKSWWDEKRQEAYAKEYYCCWACGVHKSAAKYHKWLEGHECYRYNYALGTAEMIEVTALCHSCHNFIHSGKLQYDYKAGRISYDRYRDILDHGNRIIGEYGLDNIENPYIIDKSSIADWKSWRLIIDGKEFYSKFKDINEWYDFYNRR